MAFFNSFTDSIKQKWLQFFQANRDWIKLHMEVESVYTPDGGKRPPSYLILGVVNALEPKLAQLMFPFSKLNPDADTLIEVLELNFDPDIVLGNHLVPQEETERHQYESAVEDNIQDETDETLAMSQTNGFGLDSEHQTLILEAVASGFNDLDEIPVTNGTKLQDQFQHTNGKETEDFDEVNFDIIAESTEQLEEQILGELNTPDENAFSDVLSDVWGDETSLQKTEDNNDFLGEELPAGVFDESEIARLFPNA
jgi:hypothetical protein